MAPIRPSEAQPTYASYLLRVWRADNAGHPVCRASLEEPGTHQQIHFDSLADLYAYLNAQMGVTGTTEFKDAAVQDGE